MADLELDQQLRDIQREYLEFLDDEENQGIYTQMIRDMINANEARLIVNINDLRTKSPKRALELLTNSFEELLAFQKALRELVGSIDATYTKQHEDFFIGLEGSFGSRHLSPRTLSAGFLGDCVCVEGIVTKCSLVRPKVVRSVHYCPTTKKVIERRYADLTSYEAFPTGAAYPTKDEDGNLLETEYGLSTYKDHQTLSIQEMPEKAPAGQLPRSIDVICDNDLVDSCKPGDRVQVIGTYRCLPNKQGGFTSGAFRTIVIANNVSLKSKDVTPTISVEDVKKCKKFCKNMKGNIFETLAKSLAPSIQGHDYIKKALLCMLLGGVEKVLPNGTRLRGDINMLLIGDPSVAKSQLLRYVLFTAPRAITTTGRGSSGVGLTAAVTTDQETGDRRLEAGAMVLADRGIVCIDEFDKMSDMDRTAIHEVMEQGRVTIAKAGIHARLNARCSVLAAANPVYGRYDQYKTPMENIGLQDSLLSRFDCLFIMLDTVEAEQDRRISEHVVRIHRYRGAGEQDGDVLPLGSGVDLLTTANMEEDADQDTPIYEKHDPLLHGATRTRRDRIISMKFIRKYIYIARTLKPTLTKEASDFIAEEYSKLRSQDTENTEIARTQPVTARALETLIRLSTAHAKARLSKSVEMVDAEAAVELVQYAYFKKVMEKPKKRDREDTDDDSQSEGESGDTRRKKRKSRGDETVRSPKRPRKQPGDEGFDPYDWDSCGDDEDDPGELHPERQREMDSELPLMLEEVLPPTIADERFRAFKSGVQKLLAKERAQSIPMVRVREFLNNEHSPALPFTSTEITAAVARMTDANQIMVAEDILFLI